MSDKPRRKTAAQPPVSAHPAFPVIVALWFAALFGIGSMVLPIGLFERAALSTGLADVYAGAQPPLGATARMAVAVMAALVGAAAGLFVARRIAAANAQPASRRAAAMRREPEADDGFAKRPISAHEELGEGGLDAPEPEPVRKPVRGRRRPLAVTEESARSDFLALAPLPGRSANEAEEPLDLVAFSAPAAEDAAPAEPELAESTESAPGHAEPAVEAAASFGSAILSAPAVFAAPAPEPEPETRADAINEEPTAAPATPLAERALDGLGVVELVERFAQALERHKAAAAEPVRDTCAIVAIEPAAVAPTFAAASAEAQVPANETAEAPAAAPAIPAAFCAFALDEDEDEDEESDLPDLDLTAALSRGRGAFAAPPQPAEAAEPVLAVDPDEDEGEPAEDDAGYPSLLTMKSPFGLAREPLRIDDDEPAGDDGVEPVVIFPGQSAYDPFAAAAPTARLFDPPLDRAEAAADAGARFKQPAPRPDAGNTEQALREALEKLQRLSGAA